jgi:hypothetical protein
MNMIRILTIFFLVLLGSTAVRGQFNDGFLGHPWGTPLVQMEKEFALRPTAVGSRTQQYRANIDTVGGVEICSCDFEFTAGRLTGVIILTRRREDSHHLLALLKKVYGTATQDTTLGYQWISGRTHASYDEGSDGNGYVYLYCLKLAGM